MSHDQSQVDFGKYNSCGVYKKAAHGCEKLFEGVVWLGMADAATGWSFRYIGDYTEQLK